MNDRAMDKPIQGLAEDSRTVKPQDLFFAIRGETVDGRDFIEAAIQRGAVLVLAEDKVESQSSSKIPIIPFLNLKEALGHMASLFFSEPSKAISVIGITGTNGKTSSAHFIAQLLSLCHQSCGVIGTLGIGFIDQLKGGDCTTPGAITVQQSLAYFKDQGSKAVAMEVSSHALMQYRVAGTQFKTAIFTNLTRDHLDYHQTMAHYFAAKQKLFTEFKPKQMLINLDDEYGRQLIQNNAFFQENRRVIGYTTKTRSEIYHLFSFLKEKPIELITTETVQLEKNGIHAHLKTPFGEGLLKTAILGHFNLSNLLAVLGAVCLEGIPLETVLENMTRLKTVPGRMVTLGGDKGLPSVVIDYAHTPDALQQLLKAVRPHCKGKVFCIFGCGGDRDRGKRPQMASLAEELSDYVIMAPDNPRTEDPKQIFADMILGLKNKDGARIEYDRGKAIAYAINQANAEDLVVIAGKGHEDYQVINHEKVPFCDKKEAEKILQERLL